ncbi:MAG: lipoyl synthase [Candidatus Omnitrophica bacterium]|nr:lipoyl synthase [Candidatus Omnitrophota bacterium]
MKPLPSWFKQSIPEVSQLQAMKNLLTSASLHTVCEGALCPNLGQCWGQGVATFMILGHCCTRACRFCAVPSGVPEDVDPEEPEAVAQAVKSLKLNYVVVTSVTRDDLPDEGADQFVAVIRAIRRVNPDVKVEILVPDFSGRGGLMEQVILSRPEVIGHNIEMAERLFSDVRPQALYRRSLDVLRVYNEYEGCSLIKSGFMVGLGESREEVFQTMDDLAEAGCDIVTIGQYLAPSKHGRHVPVERFYTPEEFDEFKIYGEQKGIRYILSGPLVRSSFIAEQGYLKVTK